MAGRDRRDGMQRRVRSREVRLSLSQERDRGRQEARERDTAPARDDGPSAGEVRGKRTGFTAKEGAARDSNGMEALKAYFSSPESAMKQPQVPPHEAKGETRANAAALPKNAKAKTQPRPAEAKAKTESGPKAAPKARKEKGSAAERRSRMALEVPQPPPPQPEKGGKDKEDEGSAGAAQLALPNAKGSRTGFEIGPNVRRDSMQMEPLNAYFSSPATTTGETPQHKVSRTSERGPGSPPKAAAIEAPFEPQVRRSPRRAKKAKPPRDATSKSAVPKRAEAEGEVDETKGSRTGFQIGKNLARDSLEMEPLNAYFESPPISKPAAQRNERTPEARALPSNKAIRAEAVEKARKALALERPTRVSLGPDAKPEAFDAGKLPLAKAAARPAKAIARAPSVAASPVVDDFEAPSPVRQTPDTVRSGVVRSGVTSSRRTRSSSAGESILPPGAADTPISGPISQGGAPLSRAFSSASGPAGRPSVGAGQHFSPVPFSPGALSSEISERTPTRTPSTVQQEQKRRRARFSLASSRPSTGGGKRRRLTPLSSSSSLRTPRTAGSSSTLSSRKRRRRSSGVLYSDDDSELETVDSKWDSETDDGRDDDDDGSVESDGEPEVIRVHGTHAKNRYNVPPEPRDPSSRSRRTRFAPLRFWEGERIQYKRLDRYNTHVDKAVKAGKPKLMVTPEPLRLRSEMNRISAERVRKRASQRHVRAPLLPSNLKTSDETEEVVVEADEPGKEMPCRVVTRGTGLVLSNLRQDGDKAMRVENGVTVEAKAPQAAFMLKDEEFFTGLLKLPPLGKKVAERSTTRCVFHVLAAQKNGTVVSVSDKNYVVNPGDQFTVPKGVEFSIANYSGHEESSMAFFVLESGKEGRPGQAQSRMQSQTLSQTQSLED